MLELKEEVKGVDITPSQQLNKLFIFFLASIYLFKRLQIYGARRNHSRNTGTQGLQLH